MESKYKIGCHFREQARCRDIDEEKLFQIVQQLALLDYLVDINIVPTTIDMNADCVCGCELEGPEGDGVKIDVHVTRGHCLALRVKPNDIAMVLTEVMGQPNLFEISIWGKEIDFHCQCNDWFIDALREMGKDRQRLI